MICRIGEWNEEVMFCFFSLFRILEIILKNFSCFFRGMIFDRFFVVIIRFGLFIVKKNK